MKTYLFHAGQGLIISLTFLLNCNGQAAEPAMRDSLMPPSPIHQGQQLNKVMYGRVLKTMDAAGYTYVELQAGNKKVWAAGPVTKISQGDAVRIGTGMPMRNFHSKSLKRDFALLYFTNSIVMAPGGHSAMPTAMGAQGHKAPPAKPLRPLHIQQAKNGKTIAEIYKNRKQLAGKQVRVRGKVVKFIGNIYGKNWIHIRDGSSGQNLLVITKDRSQADVILVKGKVVLNKDNGIGHVYEVVLDDAQILGQ